MPIEESRADVIAAKVHEIETVQSSVRRHANAGLIALENDDVQTAMNRFEQARSQAQRLLRMKGDLTKLRSQR